MKGYLYKELKQNCHFLYLSFTYAICGAFLPIVIVMVREQTLTREAFLLFGQKYIYLRFLGICGFLISLCMQALVFREDDRKIWGYFVASSPKGIRSYIYTKYGLIAGMCISFFLLSAGFDYIFTLIAQVVGGIALPPMTEVYTILFFFQLLCHATEIPYTVLFGTQKGMIIKLFPSLIITIFIIIIAMLRPLELFEFIDNVVYYAKMPNILKWSFPIISSVAFILSCLLSCKLYIKGVHKYYK